MHRATYVYLVMAAVAVGGLWAVLAAGQRLVPPEDLAGKWELTPLPGSTELGKTMLVEQSGRFFQFAFANGLMLELTLDPTPALAGQPITMQMSGRGYQLTAAGSPDTNRIIFRLQGPRAGRWTAKRIVRTFSGEGGNNPSPAGAVKIGEQPGAD